MIGKLLSGSQNFNLWGGGGRGSVRGSRYGMIPSFPPKPGAFHAEDASSFASQFSPVPRRARVCQLAKMHQLFCAPYQYSEKKPASQGHYSLPV